jgi:hypothetical protein
VRVDLEQDGDAVPGATPYPANVARWVADEIIAKYR